MSLTLFIANKAYSSWSARPWLLMRALDIPFAEKTVPLYVEGSRETVLKEAPTGKLPVLRDGDLAIWDSLAIIEYLAEKFPDKDIWPSAPRDRAQARSLCAEMHSGFMPFRQNCPTNFRRENRQTPREIDEAAQADLARIEQIFKGARGPLLFGKGFCAADAFFAPVVSRIEAYDLNVGVEARAYCDRILALPAYRDWRQGAQAETWVIDKWEGL
jgi:glutathione S-transferase